MIAHLHFLRPLWLLALVPVVWLLWRHWRGRRQGGVWQSVCDAHLLPHLLIGTPTRSARTPLWLLGMAGVLTVIALAGPVWSKLPQPLYHNSAATVVILSLADTMNAPDLTPSRLERAKLKLLDFLQRQREGQTALIAYAGEAYVVSPLTDDAATIASLVNSLEPNMMPVAGNNLSEALNKADALLDQDGVFSGGRVLLIGDDADGSAALKRAAALQHKGRVLSVLAVGTTQGAPIAAANGGFVKDRNGAIVIPSLNLPALRQLALSGGGQLVSLTTSDDDLNHLWPGSQAALFKTKSGESQHADIWREEGPWLLLLVIPLLALVWRQGWLALIVLALLLPQPHSAQASSWDNLWARPDQQAYRALQHGDAKSAATTFTDPAWRSVAQYRAGDYAAAAAGFGQAHTPDALYNQGNALARAGKLEQAAQNYRKVLQQQPANHDAQHNLKIVEDLLKQQHQKQSTPDSAQNQQQKQNQNGQQSAKGQHGESQQNQQGQSQQQASQGQHGQSGQPQQAQTKPEGQSEKNPSAQQAPSASQSADKQNSTPQAQQQADTKASQSGQDKPTHSGQTAESTQANPDSKNNDKAEKSQPQPGTANHAEDSQQARANAVVQQSPANSESNQALEQWLRRIPDDPGGLLRRKFMMQHQQREQAADNDSN